MWDCDLLRPLHDAHKGLDYKPNFILLGALNSLAHSTGDSSRKRRIRRSGAERESSTLFRGFVFHAPALRPGNGAPTVGGSALQRACERLQPRTAPHSAAGARGRAGAIAFALLALVVLATRFLALGAKPYHHDESLFAHRAYHLSVTGDYNYDPILHGPFLIDAQALVFRLVGDSDFTARLVAAISGVLLLAAVWSLRDRLGRTAAAVSVALLIVSPTILFYSRFNRNDVPFTLAAMTFVLCIVRFAERARLRWWFLALLAVAWMICLKETYVIFLFTAATFALGAAILEARMPLSAGEPSELGSWPAPDTSGRDVQRAPGFSQTSHPTFWLKFALVTALGLAAGLLLIVTLYTTFFRHPHHADGPLEALRYWAGQHAAQRIFGEFHYYVPILAIYEFLPLALVIWGVGRTVRRAPWLHGRIAWAWAAASAALLALLAPVEFPPSLAALLHMTQGWQLWLALEVFALCAAACAVLVLERRRLAAFLLWWTMGAFLAYSYAGEKVPWIAVHIVFPLILAAGVFAQDLLAQAGRARPQRRRIVAAVVLAAFAVTAFNAWRLSFPNAANPAERHVYTHTTEAFAAITREVHDLAARVGGERSLADFPVVVAGDALWPSQWYFRRLGFVYSAPTNSRIPVFICDEYLDPNHRERHALQQWPWLVQSHYIWRVPFREWWHQAPQWIVVRRLFDIWMALVPEAYRQARVTDARGRPVVWIGDGGRLPNMTVAEKIAASRHAWRSVFDYILFRRDFDPYRFHYATRDHMAVLYCVRKDLYKAWLAKGGGRALPRRRRIESPPAPRAPSAAK